MQAACFACALHADILAAQEDLCLPRANPLHDHYAALHECAVQKMVVGRLTAIHPAVGHFVL
jgi:hypothetical protein